MTTLTDAARGREHLTLRETLADSRVLAVRQLRKVLRRPTYVVFAFVQPVLLVLMFRYVFGAAINTGGIDYADFLMPGIMVQTAIFGALITGLGLTEDLAAGVVDRFRSLPMARSALLVGRTAADLVVNCLTLTVMVLVGLAVGFRPTQSPQDLLLAFGLVLAFAYVFSWISAFVGLSVRDPETAQSAGFIWVFPLTFVSSAFVPTAAMPGAIQAFADANPVSSVVDAARALTIGHGETLPPVLTTLAWLVGLLLVFVPLAVRAFRRA
jgi:ABC-2 type transport system permease protein